MVFKLHRFIGQEGRKVFQTDEQMDAQSDDVTSIAAYHSLKYLPLKLAFWDQMVNGEVLDKYSSASSIVWKFHKHKQPSARWLAKHFEFYWASRCEARWFPTLYSHFITSCNGE